MPQNGNNGFRAEKHTTKNNINVLCMTISTPERSSTQNPSVAYDSQADTQQALDDRAMQWLHAHPTEGCWGCLEGHLWISMAGLLQAPFAGFTGLVFNHQR